MRADHAVRYNAAVGALLGLAVGDALSHQARLPPTRSADPINMPHWGGVAASCFAQAEALIKGDPIDMGIGASEVVASAIRLAKSDAAPPLLGDPTTVLMCGVVRDAMAGELDLADTSATCESSRTAFAAVQSSTSFAGAIEQVAASPASAASSVALTGAVAGLVWGPASIPAAWVTTVSGLVGDRTYGMRQLRRLAERLLQFDAPTPPEPRRSLGPREVAPRLWLSNLHAVPRFVASHPEGAVVSLCPTTGAFDQHPLRREFTVHDAGGRTVNPLLGEVLDEVLDSIEAFHEAEREVLVHCHHGASRTGFVLRAWLMRHLSLNYDDAMTEAQVRWSKTSTWNRSFNEELKRRDTTPPTSDTHGR